jgi:hypothetical protein
MKRSDFDRFVRVAASTAAFSVTACAAVKPASPPSQANSAHAVPLAAAPSVSAAASAQTPPPPAAMPVGSLTRAGGVVISEDAAGRSLTIKDYSGRTRTFRIAGGARVSKGGAEAAVALDGIKSGDRVRLKVGGDVAASVHVLVERVQ